MRFNITSAVWKTLVYAGIVLLLGIAPAAADQTKAGKAAPGEKGESTYVAYYFYTSKRCGPCRRIEEWAGQAIRENFQKEIEKGRLEWRALNVEKPENKHFIKDFSLYTKSVVIVEQKAGEPVRWKNLKKVWELYRDKEKYFDYVAGKTRAFMENG